MAASIWAIRRSRSATVWPWLARRASYLRVPDDKAEADRGIRILETVKSNYAAPGKPVRLQWSDGGLALEHAPSSLHRLAKDAECEDIFLRLLDERSAQGRHVSDKNGKNYAPAVFADMGGSGGFTAKAFAQAMDRLFTARKITLKNIRVDGKTRAIIDRAAANTPPAGGGMSRQRPANTKIRPPTRRLRAAITHANKPPTRQHPARHHPHTPYARARQQTPPATPPTLRLRCAYDGVLPKD